MQIDDIERFLPHRKPMLLLDSVSVEDGVARGKLRIDENAWFVQGHFPGNPVVPGVILCEILAQTTAFLLADGVPENKTPFLAGLDAVRLKRPVKPGEVFESECRVKRAKGPFYFTDCKGYVDGALCVKAELFFALMDKESDDKKEDVKKNERSNERD